jgi:hypothetical protein
MKMGTAQKQNISVQHRMWNRYDSRPKQAITEQQLNRMRFCCNRQAQQKLDFLLATE